MTYGEIIRDSELVRKTLKDCYFSADYPVKKWEMARKFISTVIDKSGVILDIGCANGFLLKSLEYWSGRELTPYGIDHIEKNIINSHVLFPDSKKNFITLSRRLVTNVSESVS